MDEIRRIFVEKKEAFAVEARAFWLICKPISV